MRAEVTFLCRVVFRIDEDRIVRTSGHAGFTADADRFVEINDAVGALEHRGGRTRRRTRRVRALIATRYLMGAPHLRPHTDVDVFDVSARHADRNNVLRLARGGTRVASDAASVVDDFRPLHTIRVRCLLVDHVC